MQTSLKLADHKICKTLLIKRQFMTNLRFYDHDHAGMLGTVEMEGM